MAATRLLMRRDLAFDKPPSSAVIVDPRRERQAPPRERSTICQESVKNRQQSGLEKSKKQPSESAANSSKEKNLEDWLGGRDSNPDNVVQSHVSYR
jgi:hypothetical protein